MIEYPCSADYGVTGSMSSSQKKYEYTTLRNPLESQQQGKSYGSRQLNEAEMNAVEQVLTESVERLKLSTGTLPGGKVHQIKLPNDGGIHPLDRPPAEH